MTKKHIKTQVEGANAPERLMWEAEANRIAQRAADALRASRRSLGALPVHVPTWTGRAGGVGGGGGGGRQFGGVAAVGGADR